VKDRRRDTAAAVSKDYFTPEISPFHSPIVCPRAQQVAHGGMP
jgi:hypothetical protein